MNVRPEQPGDHAAIRAVHATSFPTAAEAELVDALRGAGRLTISLVAEEEGEIVGHVAFSPVILEGTSDGLGLAPLATLPAFRKRSIAEGLVLEGLALCKQRDHGFVVVLGEPHYYERFGFKAASAWKLRDEYDGGGAFLALELRPGAIPAAGGLVQYSSEFAAFEEA